MLPPGSPPSGLPSPGSIWRNSYAGPPCAGDRLDEAPCRSPSASVVRRRGGRCCPGPPRRPGCPGCAGCRPRSRPARANLSGGSVGSRFSTFIEATASWLARGASVTSRCRPRSIRAGLARRVVLVVAERVVDDGVDRAREGVAGVHVRHVRDHVVEDEPLGVEVRRRDVDAAARGERTADARGHGGGLAEPVGRVRPPRGGDPHEHPLEALVEVDAVLLRVELVVGRVLDVARVVLDDLGRHGQAARGPTSVGAIVPVPVLTAEAARELGQRQLAGPRAELRHRARDAHGVAHGDAGCRGTRRCPPTCGGRRRGSGPGSSSRWATSPSPRPGPRRAVPSSGEMCCAPCTSWMREGVPGTGSCVPGPSPAALRGFGVPRVKSRLLLSVSVAPPRLRLSESVLLSPGAGPAPSKAFAAP